ncbi:diguanylate cyclase [Nodosilinea sp. LEGE 06152]|uniref:diguanylate cyclase domain-containing protein n=1 Tax=Nodosilinea sp. LEGE 06152 TaxID=2777966 RepID=UPI0018806CE3|nr:diguanylate cyclase [Nodosilinea sp. LEGE 06152]MBE9157739.1 diguanylate cyclase [Nodosilinea sp. LEGE 06152]
MVNLGSNPTSASQNVDPMLEQAPCGFLSVRDDGIIEYVNGTLCQLLGWEPGTLHGQNVIAILPMASRIFYQTHVFPMLRMQESASELYFSLRSRSGQDIPILANGVRQQRHGELINDYVVIPIRQRMQYEDQILRAKRMAEAAIGAQKQAEATLKQQYERAVALGQITQHIRESLDLPQIFAVAAQETRQGLGADRVGIFRFTQANEGADEAVGGGFVSEAVTPGVDAVMAAQVPHHGFGDHYRSIRARGGTLAIRDLHDLDEMPPPAEVTQLFSQFQVQATLVVPLHKGPELWGLIVIHHCQGPRYWQGVEVELVEDIAVQLAIAIQQADLVKQLQVELLERQRAEARLTEINRELQHATGLLEQLAHIDPLTQIANRRRFSDRLDEEWNRLSRDRLPLSLLLFDLDYFKQYNDTYGHQLGDDCLYTIAQAAQGVVGRPTDLLARYGGEEFAVILPNTHRQGAIAVAQHIHQAIAARAILHRASAVSNQVTLSLGLSTLTPSRELTSTVLIQQADQALYRAKQQGRNRTVVFDPAVFDSGYDPDPLPPAL